MPLININANDYPEEEFDALPEGVYEVVMVNSEMRNTKSGQGKFLHCEFEIISGQYKGRKVFDNINLENPSAQAVEIGMKTLARICRAVGVLSPRDSVELYNLPLLAKVTVRDFNDGSGRKDNAIKNYMARRGGPAPRAGYQPGARPPAQPRGQQQQQAYRPSAQPQSQQQQQAYRPSAQPPAQQPPASREAELQDLPPW